MYEALNWTSSPDSDWNSIENNHWRRAAAAFYEVNRASWFSGLPRQKKATKKARHRRSSRVECFHVDFMRRLREIDDFNQQFMMNTRQLVALSVSTLFLFINESWFESKKLFCELRNFVVRKKSRRNGESSAIVYRLNYLDEATGSIRHYLAPRCDSSRRRPEIENGWNFLHCRFGWPSGFQLWTARGDYNAKGKESVEF